MKRKKRGEYKGQYEM